MFQLDRHGRLRTEPSGSTGECRHPWPAPRKAPVVASTSETKVHLKTFGVDVAPAGPAGTRPAGKQGTSLKTIAYDNLSTVVGVTTPSAPTVPPRSVVASAR